MSDMRRRLAELEKQLAALEARSPSACCPSCRLPLSGEDREAALVERFGETMAMYFDGDELPPRFCDSCRLRRELEPLRLSFSDDDLAEPLAVADTAGPGEGES